MHEVYLRPTMYAHCFSLMVRVLHLNHMYKHRTTT